MEPIQKKTLLQVIPSEKNPLLIGLDQLLSNLPFEECRRHIERVIETAVSTHDESTVLQWLRIYQTAVHNASSDYAQKYEHINSFRSFLKNLFWILPEDIVNNVPYQDAYTEPQFLFTKQFIVEQVIEGWNPDICAASLDVFYFLVATYGSFVSPAPLREETEWELKAKKRLVTEKTQKMVLAIIRDWLSKRDFKTNSLEGWITQPRVLPEILKLLAHAWVRVTDGENIAGHLRRSRHHLLSCIT